MKRDVCPKAVTPRRWRVTRETQHALESASSDDLDAIACCINLWLRNIEPGHTVTLTDHEVVVWECGQ